MVTRTLKVTEAEILVIDTATEIAESVPMSFSKVFKNEKQILKEAQKMLGDTNKKAVAVKGFNVAEHRYGMSEADFIAHSVELDPLNK